MSFWRRRLAWFFLVFKNHSSTHTHTHVYYHNLLSEKFINISWFSPMHVQKWLLWIERSYELILLVASSSIHLEERRGEGEGYLRTENQNLLSISPILSLDWMYILYDTYILSEFCVLASIFSIMWSFFLHESGGLTRNGKKLMFHVKSALLFLFLVSISLFDIFLPSFIKMAIKASSKGWVPSWSVKVWDPDTRQARSGRVVDGSSK